MRRLFCRLFRCSGCLLEFFILLFFETIFILRNEPNCKGNSFYLHLSSIIARHCRLDAQLLSQYSTVLQKIVQSYFVKILVWLYDILLFENVQEDYFNYPIYYCILTKNLFDTHAAQHIYEFCLI
jgi:hypothetical protein